MMLHEFVPGRGYPFKVVRDGFWITTRASIERYPDGVWKFVPAEAAYLWPETPSRPLDEYTLFRIKGDGHGRIYRVPGDPLGRGVVTIPVVPCRAQYVEGCTDPAIDMYWNVSWIPVCHRCLKLASRYQTPLDYHGRRW